MSRRAPGRRVSRRVRTAPVSEGRGAGPVLGVAAAVLTLAVLAAGTVLPHPRTGDTVAAGTRRTAVGRELVCAGGLPGARGGGGAAGSSAGALTAGGAPLPAGARPRPLSGPLMISAPASTARDAWAVQEASTSSWLAASSCPAPQAEWWFPGAGAATRHRGVLELSNPRDGDAIVDVDVLGPRGPVPAPGLRGIRVASGRTVRLDLAKVSAAYGDLAVHVSATRGLVTAALPEQWAPAVVARPVQEWVTGQPAAERHPVLLGTGGRGEAATLLVANPSMREAVVTVQLLTPGGVVAPRTGASLTVPPGTVRSVAFPSAAAADALGVRLSSQVPVSATVRAVQRGDEAYAVAAEVLGSDAVVGVPPTGTGRLVFAAARAGTVTVRTYDGNGRLLGSREVAVPARGAVTTPVPHGAAAVRLGMPSSLALRAALLVSSGSGIATVAVPAAATDAEVPAVVPLGP